jgi:hypothetical protein
MGTRSGRETLEEASMTSTRSRTATSVRRQLESVRHAINQLHVLRDVGRDFTDLERDRYMELVVAEDRLLHELRATSEPEY